MKQNYLIGLIGTGIQASLTPAMHMREGEARAIGAVNTPGRRHRRRPAQGVETVIVTPFILR